MVIPHHLAKLPLTWFLETYSNYSEHLKEFMISATMFLLKHNYFKFDTRFYLQISGATMGATFSLALANVYMAWWKNMFIFQRVNLFCSSLVWYGRYIDDLIIIWRSDVEAIPDLMTYLNRSNLGLRFTHNYDSQTI